MFSGENWKEVPLWVIAFLISAAFHEAAHAWSAYKLGDDTAARAGRMTINPLVHIDPVGLIFLIFMAASGVGIGWAKPVPVNPYNLRNPRWDNMLIALAGPVTNIILAVVFILIFKAFAGQLLAEANPISKLLGIFLVLNMVLAAFNLVPVYPLDGSHIVEGLLPENLAELWEKTRPFGLFVLLGLLFTGWISYIFLPAWIFLELALGPEVFSKILSMI